MHGTKHLQPMQTTGQQRTSAGYAAGVFHGAAHVQNIQVKYQGRKKDETTAIPTHHQKDAVFSATF